MIFKKMKKKSDGIFITILLLFIFIYNIPLFAEGAGSRAAFTRGGWAGARYVAMGGAGEVICDDIYAIYWNPAGLTALSGKHKLSGDEIKEKARKGRVDDISEADLLNFSEDEKKENTYQIGASASLLDVERKAGFAGFAFDFFGGVLGTGMYSIFSTGIESYNESGVQGEDLNYIAAVPCLSYAWAVGVTAIGITVKGLYEKIGTVEYMGLGADFGAQFDVLPFLRLGFVLQDLGTGLSPVDKGDDVDPKYDFASPSLKLGVALVSDSGVTIALTTVKKIEQNDYEMNIGAAYKVADFLSVYLGINDNVFTTGVTVKLFTMDFSYALSVDRIDSGYNNTVSFSLFF